MKCTNHHVHQTPLAPHLPRLEGVLGGGSPALPKGPPYDPQSKGQATAFLQQLILQRQLPLLLLLQLLQPLRLQLLHFLLT
jgi:hypothetical protein